MKLQPPTAEDIAAFHAAIEGTVPLAIEPRVVLTPPKPSARPIQRERDEAEVIFEAMYGPFEIDDLMAIGDADSYLRPGLSRAILRDLRRGRWSIQNHTDLHGLNRHDAHEEVSQFVAESVAAGKRCIRIVHGRGYGSPGREGVLRYLVKGWLSRCKSVLAFCHAPACDGGQGALWVLLRAASREKRGKRGW